MSLSRLKQQSIIMHQEIEQLSHSSDAYDKIAKMEGEPHPSLNHKIKLMLKFKATKIQLPKQRDELFQFNNGFRECAKREGRT